MNLAASLAVFLLVPPGPRLAAPALSLAGAQSATPQSSASQAPASVPAAPAQPASPTTPPKPKHHTRRKSKDPNCLDTGANKSSSGAETSKAAAASATLKPCPPKKTVVRNGGADEPPIQLTGADPAKPSSQGAAAQLLAKTEENLKKLSGRELDADQRQTLNQIREFMEQSKQATAAGDLERGQNLASKARLLSDELVKP